MVGEAEGECAWCEVAAGSIAACRLRVLQQRITSARSPPWVTRGLGLGSGLGLGLGLGLGSGLGSGLGLGLG